MYELLRYIDIIKEIIDKDYGKERVFYDNGEWYDREACRVIELDELCEILRDIYNREEW